MIEALACRVATFAGTPFAILAQLVLTGLSFAVLGTEATTLALSVEAITLSQLLLVANAKTEAIVKHALAELVRAVPKADDSIADEVDPKGA